MYTIKFAAEASAELNRIRPFHRVRILTAIEEHLSQAPMKVGRRKKRIDLGAGDFVYQLRIGEYRAFYDVDDARGLVIVRHVRRKGRATTGEVL